MQGFMIALLECSITMSVIALLYMAITPLLAKTFTAKGRYYGWLVIILGLIIPFRLHPHVPAIRLDTLLPALKISDGGSARQAVSAAAASSAIPWQAVAGGLWLAGVVVFLAYHAIRHRRFLHMVTRWSTEIRDRQALHMLHEVQAKLGIRQQVALQACPGISSPMLLGFVRPTILLPSDNILSDELPLIFKHELVHLKRRDLWYKALVLVAAAFHWFNPVVYVMARDIALQCELSCDEEVVKNTDIAGRQQYVEAIIGMLKKQSVAPTIFSTNFYGSKQGLKNRVLSIMDARSKKWGTPIVALVIAATLSTGTVLTLSGPSSIPVQPPSLPKVESSPVEKLPVNDQSDSTAPVPHPEAKKDGSASELELLPNDASPRLIQGNPKVEIEVPAAEGPKLIKIE
ncbi:M56 family metallopeptidase [Paenibacillus thiaminolyticus]|uniref:M56 family metallopeptidase n=1 Tax=Paenibacillus thiaminolyticus TaxID=49283 RepID=UPI001164E3E6|nr:M56 family metallopeptidase [Paenibacillus thiaminolyticus]